MKRFYIFLMVLAAAAGATQAQAQARKSDFNVMTATPAIHNVTLSSFAWTMALISTTSASRDRFTSTGRHRGKVRWFEVSIWNPSTTSSMTWTFAPWDKGKADISPEQYQPAVGACNLGANITPFANDPATPIPTTLEVPMPGLKLWLLGCDGAGGQTAGITQRGHI